MECYSESYKNRCLKRLEEWGAPTQGWYNVEIIDSEDANGGVYFTCELCDYPRVRFLHVMRHDDYPDDVKVGCICAGVMEGNILAAKEREKRAKRKSQYLRRTWKEGEVGSWRITYMHKNIAISREVFRDNEYYVIHLDGLQYQWKDSKRMSLLSAKHFVFDLVEYERERNREETD